jgi:hypothetical protein
MPLFNDAVLHAFLLPLFNKALGSIGIADSMAFKSQFAFASHS